MVATPVDVSNEILSLKSTLSSMAHQMDTFVSEVSRVAREVRQEGNGNGHAVAQIAPGTDNGDRVIERLIQELGEDAVLVGEAVQSRNCGWANPTPCLARAIVRPRSTEEVSQVLRICYEMRQPIVPQGGLTGLVGAHEASGTEIGLSMERMRVIEQVDPGMKTMTVQAGVPLQTIQHTAEENGLFFPLDLGARGSCSIGGNVSTNAGGNRVIRYGMARDMILGLEAVLADGTIVSSLNNLMKNNTGYDLKQLFIGTEGTLGVVTRAVLRLRPIPRSHNCALVAVADFPRLIETLRAMENGLGGSLSAFEVMWEDFYKLVTTAPAKNRRPLDYGHSHYALIESLGQDQTADGERFEAVLGECIEKGLVVDACLGKSQAERDSLWGMRDDVDQLNRIAAAVFIFDISLSIAHMPAYLEAVRKKIEAKWSDAKMVVYGHLGDCNLHLAIGTNIGKNRAYDHAAGEDLHHEVEEIVYRTLPPGGSVSAEHGIGVAKRQYLGVSRSPTEIKLMNLLKDTLDPRHILNPGKVL